MVGVLKRSTVLPHVVADFADYWETSQSNACLLHFAAGPLLAIHAMSGLDVAILQEDARKFCGC